MTNKNIKRDYFNAFVSVIMEHFPDKENDLSKLKLLKLLFLATSTDVNALSIFDNYECWNLGPVEKDVYDLINENSLDFKITNNHCENIKKHVLGNDKKELVNKILNNLLIENNNILKLRASELVDITHKWDCRQITKEMGILKIKTDYILNSRKYYK